MLYLEFLGPCPLHWLMMGICTIVMIGPRALTSLRELSFLFQWCTYFGASSLLLLIFNLFKDYSSSSNKFLQALTGIDIIVNIIIRLSKWSSSGLIVAISYKSIVLVQLALDLLYHYNSSPWFLYSFFFFLFSYGYWVVVFSLIDFEVKYGTLLSQLMAKITIVCVYVCFSCLIIGVVFGCLHTSY